MGALLVCMGFLNLAGIVCESIHLSNINRSLITLQTESTLCRYNSIESESDSMNHVSKCFGSAVDMHDVDIFHSATSNIKNFCLCSFSKDKIRWEQNHKLNQIYITYDRLSRKLSASENNFKSAYQLYCYECLLLDYQSIQANDRMYR